jgi:hypothetical protein
VFDEILDEPFMGDDVSLGKAVFSFAGFDRQKRRVETCLDNVQVQYDTHCSIYT